MSQNNGCCYNYNYNYVYNYNGFFSLLLLTICDTCSTLFDVRQYSSRKDCSVLIKSGIGQSFNDGEINLSQPKSLFWCSFDTPA